MKGGCKIVSLRFTLALVSSVFAGPYSSTVLVAFAISSSGNEIRGAPPFNNDREEMEERRLPSLCKSNANCDERYPNKVEVCDKRRGKPLLRSYCADLSKNFRLRRRLTMGRAYCGPCTSPRASPTSAPSHSPTQAPSHSPSQAPSHSPSQAPSHSPTQAPSHSPTPAPTPLSPTAPITYQITLDLTGISPQYKSSFTGAAHRWQQIITGDLPSRVVGYEKYYSECTRLPAVIDDIFICSKVGFIDGPRGILGSAGPEFFRYSSDGKVTPTIGRMHFDVDDVQSLFNQGTLNLVILHEMGHVLGIGTLWGDNKLMGADRCTYLLNTSASSEWDNLSGCTNPIPVERQGGIGTACGHWSEDCLVGELMTGYLDANAGGQISRMTVGTLQDLGYTVNYTAADPFPVGLLNPTCVCNPAVSEIQLGNSAIFSNKVNHEDATAITETSGSSPTVPTASNVMELGAMPDLVKTNSNGRNDMTRRGLGGSTNIIRKPSVTSEQDRNRVLNPSEHRLSEKGRKAAIEYGKGRLSKLQVTAAKMSQQDSSFIYVGHRYVSVLYIEDDQIYSVAVWGDDV